VSALDDDPCSAEAAASIAPPPGFHPVPRRSGFLDLVGPLLVDDTDPRAPVYGLRVGEHHTNSRGGVHGGVLTTLADVALGYGSLAAHGEFLTLVTASLTIDYTGTAAVGDWLEARTSLKRMGSRLAFASCEIVASSRPVASCSGVFSVPPAKHSG
jgi:acyl-coenzyme A thioesterase 13